ncbi:MAG: bactofilin family protein [Usitatibacter sp.]
MKRTVIAAIAAALATFAGAQPMSRMPPVERELGRDHFAAGCPMRVSQAVAGDLIAASCDLEAASAVAGDAALAGGSVRIDGSVGGGVYAAGGKVFVNGSVGRNVRTAGGHVQIGPEAKVNGNVSAAGGDVAVRGAVKGYLQAAGGHVLIDGPVDGDVVVSGGKVELGPNARIGGNLRYRTRDFTRDPAAQVTGSVEALALGRGMRAQRSPWRHRAGGGWIWSAGVMLMAALLAGALPAVSARMAAELRSHPGMSILWGLVAFACIPVAALLLLVTIIGIPLAILAILSFVALLLVAHAVTVASITDLGLRRYKPEAAARASWRAGIAILVALALAILARIPLLGGLVVLVAMLAGMGVIAAMVFRRGAPPASAAPVQGGVPVG